MIYILNDFNLAFSNFSFLLYNLNYDVMPDNIKSANIKKKHVYATDAS
jgi:hypothetical protein